MPAFLQVVGFACLAFAFALLAKPRVRPDPSTYLLAITLDALCILFICSVLVIWPSWWLLFPLMLWTGATAVHILRLRDARVMVRVLEANRPPPSWRQGKPHTNDYGSAQEHDGSQSGDTPDHYPRY